MPGVSVPAGNCGARRHVDVCGVCGGAARAVDVEGACCTSGALDAQGLCCQARLRDTCVGDEIQQA